MSERGINLTWYQIREFLEGGLSVINDFTHPDRIIPGVESVKARQIMTSLYKPLNRPILGYQHKVRGID